VIPVDLDAIEAEEQSRVLAILGDEDSHDPGNRLKSKISNAISFLMLRARYNSQRHYEIYSVPVSDDITEQDIRELFDLDPQNAAELMRGRGHKMYSARVDKNIVKIS
jgi:hypothetical protein